MPISVDFQTSRIKSMSNSLDFVKPNIDLHIYVNEAPISERCALVPVKTVPNYVMWIAQDNEKANSPATGRRYFWSSNNKRY